jgi:ActR/RegA family two-component response regulator
MNTRESAAVRVLLVSCEQKTIENLFDVMHQLGMYVEACSDSATATRQLCNSKYEGVVVDLRMGEAGLELLNNLRAFTSNKRAIPCAVLGDVYQKVPAFQAGANFILEPPLGSIMAAQTLQAAYPLMIQERRRYFRCPIETTMFVVCENDHAFQTKSVNVSRLGMAILTPMPLKIRQKLKIRMAIPGEKSPVNMDAEVCWSNPSGRAGIQFTKMSTTAGKTLESWLLGQMETLIPYSRRQDLHIPHLAMAMVDQAQESSHELISEKPTKIM